MDYLDPLDQGHDPYNPYDPYHVTLSYDLYMWFFIQANSPSLRPQLSLMVINRNNRALIYAEPKGRG